MKTVERFDVDKAVGELRARVASDLPDVNSVPRSDLASVLMTYRDAIEPHFVPWMTTTWIQCRSVTGREACRDNLLCEVRDDHPQMLRTFVEPLAGDAQAVRSKELDETIRAITDLTRDPLDGLLVMAGLENASVEFIPWMQAAAKKLGLGNLHYLDVHGVADIAHANAFIDAVKAEADVHPTAPTGDGDFVALRLVERFLRLIFRPAGPA